MVRLIPMTLALPLLAGCAANAMETDNASADSLSERDQRQLAAMLDGKTPGNPQHCITTRPNTRSTVIGRQSVLYTNGGTVYRNDLRGGCPSLRPTSVIVTQRYSSNRLCSGEILQIRDPARGTWTGSCTLGEFVPYRSE